MQHFPLWVAWRHQVLKQGFKRRCLQQCSIALIKMYPYCCVCVCVTRIAQAMLGQLAAWSKKIVGWIAASWTTYKQGNRFKNRALFEKVFHMMINSDDRFLFTDNQVQFPHGQMHFLSFLFGLLKKEILFCINTHRKWHDSSSDDMVKKFILIHVRISF